MALTKEKQQEIFLYDTPVENLFIHEFLPGAPGNAVRVYLYGLMYAELSRNISNAAIAKELGMEEAEVIQAWTYWEKKKLIVRHFPDPKDTLHFDVEFLRIKEKVYARSTHGKKAEPAESPLSDAVLKRLYSAIEQATGNVLGGKDPATILSWITEDHATPDTILEAFKYCAVSRKNTRVNYVGAVVKEWSEKGLRTAEEIAEHLEANDKRHAEYRRIMKALGFRRNATEEEQRLINNWFDNMGFSMEQILEACSKTSGISNPNVKYVNSILRSRYLEQHPEQRIREFGPTQGTVLQDRMKEYEELREKNKKEADARRAEVYAKVSDMQALEEAIRQANLESISRLLGKSGAKTSEDLRKEIQGLEEKKKQLLAASGFAEDYMEIHYACEKCHDTGYLPDGSQCECF